MEREEYGETRRRGNIEDKIFVVFEIFLKQSKKRKKTENEKRSVR